MCGIFGIISSDVVDFGLANILANDAQRRGSDASGIAMISNRGQTVKIVDGDIKITRLLKNHFCKNTSTLIGHSRMKTIGESYNQPFATKSSIIAHNGIVLNVAELCAEHDITNETDLDTEVIIRIYEKLRNEGLSIDDTVNEILKSVKGANSSCILDLKEDVLILLSNTGDLFYNFEHERLIFASEKRSLPLKNDAAATQLVNSHFVYYFDKSLRGREILREDAVKLAQSRLVFSYTKSTHLEKKLISVTPDVKRCTKCILPETMPFINFDQNGVCNYCRNYKPRNNPKPFTDFENLVEPYRRNGQHDVILPFSGGRDSCFGLHLAVNKLGLRPITYTYDWGMVTDLGRNNISKMTSELNVQNIVISADIRKKRKNIRNNFCAWLKRPDLGMVSILTAGDKHFFKYVEHVKNELDINLNLWGINPLEVTHFKAGFLGIPPYFDETKVYNNGIMKQLKYQSKRFGAMCKSPAYFNSSLLDTLSGEYYRSFTKKMDYFHIFDYWKWSEDEINRTLIDIYDWEVATDTTTTWRIGDGTAGMYNYIYNTIAGFTEHDTFRSNQIRENQLTRKRALELVKEENLPRYENISWYLSAIDLDFENVIDTINNVKRLY